MKANDLRKIIAEVVKELNAYYGDNTGSFRDKNYKVNYQLNNAILLERQRTFIVDFDVWCKKTVDVETIADEIELLFNYKTYQSATFYMSSRYHADEKEIYRRTITFEVRTFNET